MDPLALVLRTAVAAVLAAAGAAKLRDLDGSRRAMQEFGMPAPIASTAGVALPLAELAAAAALAIPALARPGALLAAALLAAMSATVVRLLAIGRAPDCHCFGSLRSEPVSPATLARGVALAAAAVVVAIHGPGGSIGLVGPVGAEAVLPLGSACAAWILAGRSARRPRLFPDSLAPGAAAPAFTLPRTDGGDRSLDALLSGGRPAALLFVEPGCGPCGTLLSELGGWRPALARALSLAVIIKGDRDDGRTVERMHGLDDLMVDEQGSTLAAYGVGVTPAAVLVGADGRVARAPAAGKEGIEALLRIAIS